MSTYCFELTRKLIDQALEKILLIQNPSLISAADCSGKWPRWISGRGTPALKRLPSLHLSPNFFIVYQSPGYCPNQKI